MSIPTEMIQQLGTGGVIVFLLWFLLSWFMKQYLVVQQELITTLTTVVRENSTAFQANAAAMRELNDTIKHQTE